MILTFDIGVDSSVIDETITVVVDVTYAPAKLYGLPENCHPDESEVELISWAHNGLTPCQREAVDRWLDSPEGTEAVDMRAWEYYHEAIGLTRYGVEA